LHSGRRRDCTVVGEDIAQWYTGIKEKDARVGCNRESISNTGAQDLVLQSDAQAHRWSALAGC